jgi:hypothetical protein
MSLTLCRRDNLKLKLGAEVEGVLPPLATCREEKELHFNFNSQLQLQIERAHAQLEFAPIRLTYRYRALMSCRT